jgi:hypothetical protein
MGDLRYALTVIITLIRGYFNRDDAFAEMLDRYNDEFPLEEGISIRLDRMFDLITECGFERKSRLWKKADLFTVLVELDSLSEEREEIPQPSELLDRLTTFYDSIDSANVDGSSVRGIYYKAAVQATNDKVNRLRRAQIIGGIIRGHEDADIWGALESKGLAQN